MSQLHKMQTEKETRFGFGENWRRFLLVLNEGRILEAEASLMNMLGCGRLKGRRFLDIGSGSGLHSLAARRLGAEVCSFDYDPQSVRCTAELKRRYFPDDALWQVGRGSVLDRTFVSSLGEFDIVYSWGVLHHTGAMWDALDCARLPVRPGGLLFVAVYNDQGWLSHFWRAVKRAYCSGPAGRALVPAVLLPLLTAACFAKDVVGLKSPLRRYRDYQKKNRGMSVFHDWIDWLGGYPFEVAAPAAVIGFYKAKGFDVVRVQTTRGWGNNEFVFRARETGVRI